MSLKSLRRFFLEVLPKGAAAHEERLPVSVRVPKDLLARIDAAARATNNSRTNAILHLVRYALALVEADLAKAEQLEAAQKAKKAG